MSDETQKPSRDALAAMGLLAAMSGFSDTPRRQEPPECEHCHEKGFHASTCYYVVMEAWLAHYKWCKVCKPGVKNVEPSTVLCPRGLKLYRKANDVPAEVRMRSVFPMQSTRRG